MPKEIILTIERSCWERSWWL